MAKEGLDFRESNYLLRSSRQQTQTGNNFHLYKIFKGSTFKTRLKRIESKIAREAASKTQDTSKAQNTSNTQYTSYTQNTSKTQILL